MFGKDKIKNAVHCSDLPEDGLIEVRTHIFWFSELMGTNEKGTRSNGLTTYICLDFFFIISGAVLFQGVGSLSAL